MERIAVFYSGNGEAASKITSLFNEGSRLKVVLGFTDSDCGDFPALALTLGIRIVKIKETRTDQLESVLADALRSEEVSLIALDSPSFHIPAEVATEFKERMVVLSSPEEAPREIVAALKKKEILDSAEHQENKEKTEETEKGRDTVEIRKNRQENPIEEPSVKGPSVEETETREETVDEEWARTLQIKFEPPRLTPPPLPKEAMAETTDSIKPLSTQTIAKKNSYLDSNIQVNEMTGQQDSPVVPMPKTWLVWAILSAIFCCTLPGIIAIIYAAQVSTRYADSDYAAAERASELAERWILASFVLGVLSATLYLPIMIITG